MRYITYSYLGYPFFALLPQAAVTRLPAKQMNSLTIQNQFPPVNTERLNKSAHKFQELMEQADLLIDKIISDPKFAIQLMEEAQLSNKEKVQELIESAGVVIKIDIDYHPSGINVELDNSEVIGSCCKLVMALNW